MFEKSTEKHWNPSYSFFRTPILRCKGPQAPRWAISPSTVRWGVKGLIEVLTAYSGEQSQHCQIGWSAAIDPANDVAECRGPMQCRWLHNKSCYTRRQQSQDSKIRCTRAFDEASKIKRHESTAQCYWCTAQHDTFRYMLSFPITRVMLTLYR